MKRDFIVHVDVTKRAAVHVQARDRNAAKKAALRRAVTESNVGGRIVGVVAIHVEEDER